MAKLRPIMKYHGGKYYICDWIISHFPPKYEELDYIEGFGGAASVLMNKKQSTLEIYNDLYPPVANVFLCLRYWPEKLCEKLASIEYTEEVFEQAKKVEFKIGSVDSAVAEIILCRMSRGGMKKHFAFSKRLRGGLPGDVNAWNSFKKLLPILAHRFSQVAVANRDAIGVIQDYNHALSLIYLDPPYVKETRVAKNVYGCEMETTQHIAMAEACKASKGKVLISAYDSELYRQLFKDWNWVSKEIANHSGQTKTKQKRVEWLIKNY